MTRRELKKSAYKCIVKDNKSHQETFDELKSNGVKDLQQLAEDVAAIPSAVKTSDHKALIYVYIGFLLMIIVLRTVAVFGLTLDSGLNKNLLILFIILGILVPLMGIYGALISRVELYKTIGILMALAVLRSFRDGIMDQGSLALLVLIPFVGAIALAFYIPGKLKTGFNKQVIKIEEEGQIITKVEYIFKNEAKVKSSELVDDLV